MKANPKSSPASPQSASLVIPFDAASSSVTWSATSGVGESPSFSAGTPAIAIRSPIQGATSVS